jgi:hypothetical protein
LGSNKTEIRLLFPFLETIILFQKRGLWMNQVPDPITWFVSYFRNISFYAHCSVLFQKHAEYYLDPESLAMTSAFLAKSLRKYK